MEMVMMIDERTELMSLRDERESEAVVDSDMHEIVPGEDRDDEIVALHNQGLTVIEIAKRLGWPTQKVSHRVRMCRKYGQIEALQDNDASVWDIRTKWKEVRDMPCPKGKKKGKK